MTSGEREYLLCQVLLVRPCLFCSLVHGGLALGKVISGWVGKHSTFAPQCPMSLAALLLLGPHVDYPSSMAQKPVLLGVSKHQACPWWGCPAVWGPSGHPSLHFLVLLCLTLRWCVSGSVAPFYTKGQTGMVCWPSLTGTPSDILKSIFAFGFCHVTDCRAFWMWISFLSLAGIFSNFINFTSIGKFSALSA